MAVNLKQGVMRRYHIWLSSLQRLFDAVVVIVLLMVLCFVNDVPYSKLYQVLGVLSAAFAWIALGAVDVYRAWRGSSIWKETSVILTGWILVVVCLLFIAWVTKSGDLFSRKVLGSWFLVTPFVLSLVHVLVRFSLRLLRMNGRNSRRVVIVGAGDLGKMLAQRIQQSDWMGMQLIGFFDDDVLKSNEDIFGAPILGTTKDVYAFVRDQSVDQVYLALPMRAEKRMRKVFDQLQDTTASLFLVPDLFVFELMGAREQNVDGLPTFALCETPMTGPFGMLKRVEDIVLSLIILLLISPIMLVISIAVKLTSVGPILFKQVRYGLHGEKIKVYKFRTMTTCDNDETVIRQASIGDDRITPLGAFLRRTSLDELPQFFNVLQGRMSVVGPRPHAVAHNEQYRKLIKGYMWRHKMKPGITGWAQINGWRGETDTLDKMEKRVEFDLEYIRRWSIGFDLKIVLLTVFKGFLDKNAY